MFWENGGVNTVLFGFRGYAFLIVETPGAVDVEYTYLVYLGWQVISLRGLKLNVWMFIYPLTDKIFTKKGN